MSEIGISSEINLHDSTYCLEIVARTMLCNVYRMTSQTEQQHLNALPTRGSESLTISLLARICKRHR